MIDIHAHFVPPELIRALERDGPRLGVRIVEDERGGKRARFAGDFETHYAFFDGLTDLAGRIELQGRMGIERQVLSGWMDMVGYDLEPRHGQEYSRLANEALAELVRQHPRHLLGMATVSLQDGALAAEELRHAARELGFRAVQIGTNVNGRNLDDPRHTTHPGGRSVGQGLDPFWAACQETGVLVFIHPHRPAAAERLAEYFTINALGNPFETTVAAASLLYGGVLERFPELNVCLAHGGGFLPYQLGRLDHGYAVKPEARIRAPLPPSHYLDRLYFDGITHDGAAFRYLVEVVGPDHVLFGTDVPFPMADEGMARHLTRVPELTPEKRALIERGNAARLLGLSA